MNFVKCLTPGFSSDLTPGKHLTLLFLWIIYWISIKIRRSKRVLRLKLVQKPGVKDQFLNLLIKLFSLQALKVRQKAVYIRRNRFKRKKIKPFLPKYFYSLIFWRYTATKGEGRFLKLQILCDVLFQHLVTPQFH